MPLNAEYKAVRPCILYAFDHAVVRPRDRTQIAPQSPYRLVMMGIHPNASGVAGSRQIKQDILASNRNTVRIPFKRQTLLMLNGAFDLRRNVLDQTSSARDVQ